MSEFLSFVLAGVLRILSEGPQAAAANPDRPDLTEVRMQGLRSKNIFSPFRTKPFPTKTQPGSGKGPDSVRVESPARPKPPVLTGIVYDEASKGFQAIVEDRNEERLRRLEKPRFVKAGDDVLGVRIEAVEKDKVVVVLGDVRKELTAGDALPDPAPEGAATEVKPASTPTVESKPVEPGVVNSVLEDLKKKNKKKDRTYDEP